MWKCLECGKKVKYVDAHNVAYGHNAFENLIKREERK